MICHILQHSVRSMSDYHFLFIYFFLTGADVTIQNGYKQTALHCAANNGHTECVKLLIEYGKIYLKNYDSFLSNYTV